MIDKRNGCSSSWFDLGSCLWWKFCLRVVRPYQLNSRLMQAWFPRLCLGHVYLSRLISAFEFFGCLWLNVWPQVQAADSLLKLVSELKQTAIFSGFASLNDHVEKRIVEFNQQAENTDRLLARIGEEAAASLKELESHYYSSALRTAQNFQPWAWHLQ